MKKKKIVFFFFELGWKKKKIFFNKLYLWLEDFYLHGKDNYSSFSIAMLQCSKNKRQFSNNFLY